MFQRLLLFIVGALLLLGAGAGVGSLFAGMRQRPLLVRLAFSWLFGCLWVGGGGWTASHLLGWPLSNGLFPVLAVFGAALGAPRFLVSRKNRPSETTRLVEWPWLVTAVGVGGALTVALTIVGLSNPLRDFDGRQTWLAAARIIRAEGTVSSPVLRESKWFVSHPRYPVLIPLSMVGMQELVQAPEDDRVVRAWYSLFYPVWLTLLFHFARRHAGVASAAIATVLAALPWMSTFEVWGGPTSGYSDLPLGCFLGAGFLLLLERPHLLPNSLAAGLLLGGAVLTKREGLLFALCALVAVALGHAYRTVRRRLRGHLARAGRLLGPAVAALPVFMAVALYTSWSRAIPNRFDENYEAFASVSVLIQGFRSSVALWAPAVFSELANIRVWGYLWWVFPIVLLIGIRGLKSSITHPTILLISSTAAIVFAGYSIGWAGHADILAKATWNRYVLQVSMPLFVLFSLALRARLSPLLSVLRMRGRKLACAETIGSASAPSQ